MQSTLHTGQNIITANDFINMSPIDRKYTLQKLGGRFSYERLRARHRVGTDSAISFAINNTRQNRKTIQLLKNIARSVESYTRKQGKKQKLAS